MSVLEKIEYNCKKATFLIEKENLDGISKKEKWELKMHLAGCLVCRIFQQQSLLIDRMGKAHFLGTNTDGLMLDENFKKDLHQKIEQQLKDKS